jgi:STE24 endopeptidase
VNEDKSARYHALRRRAAVAATVWSAALLVLAAGTSLSVRLRADAEGLAGLLGPAGVRPFAVVLAYVAFLGLLHEAGAVPAALYSGYLLEHRYGLSTETLRGWAADQLKGLAVGGGLSLVGFSLLYLAMRTWPRGWWAVAGGGAVVVMIVLTRVAPVVLMPIFFSFRPLGRPGLRERLLTLSNRAGVAVMDICEWQVSDRTRKANAALAGLGRTRRILVSDTLLASYTDEEIEVILAHELGHHVHRDIWKAIGYQGAVVLAGFYLANRVLVALAPRLGWSGADDVAGLPVLLLAAGLLSLALLPVSNALSRGLERAADRFAFDLTDRADVFAGAMQRLAAQNLAEERPSLLARWLFYTHPPAAERVAAARRWHAERAGPTVAQPPT